MHWAAHRDDPQILALLLEHMQTTMSWDERTQILNAPSQPKYHTDCEPSGATPLCLAAWAGSTKTVKMLACRPDVEVNAIDDRKKTPLVHASEGGHTDVVKELIRHHEIDTNAGNQRGWAAIKYAARGGKWDVLKVLLQTPWVKIKAESRDEEPLLYMAIAKNAPVEVMQQILSHVDMDTETINAMTDRSRGDCSPIFDAVSRGRSDVFTLLANDPRIDVNKEEHGRTLIATALNDSKNELLKTMAADEKFDLNKVSSKIKNTPLMDAARNSYFCKNSIDILLGSERIDPNKKNNDGYTALALLAFDEETQGYNKWLPFEKLLNHPKVDPNMQLKDSDLLTYCIEAISDPDVLKARGHDRGLLLETVRRLVRNDRVTGDKETANEILKGHLTDREMENGVRSDATAEYWRNFDLRIRY